MISNKDILNTYYDDAEEEVFPGFYDSENVEAELIPGYEDEYTIYSIHRVKPEYAELLSNDGYAVVYRIIGRGKDFIGQYVGRELYDVGDDIARIVDEDSEPELISSDQPDSIEYGKQLYDTYGPDVDVNDFDDYDAECYLAYKRSIGASTSIIATSKEIENLISWQDHGPEWGDALRKIDWQISFEDADRLINGNEDGEQRFIPSEKTIKISYPTEAALERARQNGCDKAWIVTYDDGSQSMIAYDSATDNLGKYFERKLLDDIEEGQY